MLCDPHRAVVMGHDFQSQLKATTMSSPDIRAGISLLIAALSAKGTSTIQNIEQIDRGYERIDERLRAIGLILFVLGKNNITTVMTNEETAVKATYFSIMEMPA
jgi:UDP-N-acetylglucosamine enolpyruvyl transferase